MSSGLPVLGIPVFDAQMYFTENSSLTSSGVSVFPLLKICIHFFWNALYIHPYTHREEEEEEESGLKS